VTSDVARAIDELYGVPPKEFSAARNARAAELKAAGHAKEAEAVRRLDKPSPFLWATNQLARQDPERVTHFVDVVRGVRESQLRDPRTASEGMRTIRAELQALTNRAAEVLTKAGYRVAPSASARISNTVLAAAVDSALVDDLLHGRLSRELAAPGFEVLAGAEPGRPLRLVQGGKSSEPRRERGATRADAKREQTEATRERAEAKRAQERAERERLAQKVEALRRDAEQRTAMAERAAQEVRALERQVAEARRNLRIAKREAALAANRVRRQSDS
jgi:hypothetical protein